MDLFDLVGEFGCVVMGMVGVGCVFVVLVVLGIVEVELFFVYELWVWVFG